MQRARWHAIGLSVLNFSAAIACATSRRILTVRVRLPWL
ncbi:hypothetical protein QFZ23_001524 [Arthrobacter globiformis]|nr:hypothetical protein [Arthrobacter globiformis]